MTERPLGMALMRDWRPMCARCLDDEVENELVIAIAGPDTPGSYHGDFLCSTHVSGVGPTLSFLA